MDVWCLSLHLSVSCMSVHTLFSCDNFCFVSWIPVKIYICIGIGKSMYEVINGIAPEKALLITKMSHDMRQSVFEVMQTVNIQINQ